MNQNIRPKKSIKKQYCLTKNLKQMKYGLCGDCFDFFDSFLFFER